MAHTRDDVVRTALEVLDVAGLEFFSMRRVAGALEVQPSALYHHVASKQELLALMADSILAEVGVGDDLRATCRAMREAMLSVRDGSDVVATASAFRLGVSGIETDLAARLGDRDAARTLLLYVFGQAQATQMHRQAAAVGIVADDPGLDASFERGLDIVLAGIASAS
ncbi:hypothetical protein GCM10027169_06350 [Gordonia jinhuaensis]|uniref:HTH tetR-type domain-containing protein n=1 Tax=Gordonia jinhuaensis TaxID=1517702 RepID=A0A916SYS4_9ACTN|nr:TetR family transcriptional regulator [Gordonia jinhuaensis]GGB20644.1 hypothetical protein GCM10011489_05960 [Gordonia jinhuaensis]